MKRANDFFIEEFKKRKDANPNFSLRSYARWLGMSPAQVSQMMTGKRTVTLASLRKIVEKAGLSPMEQENLFREILAEGSRAPLPASLPRKLLAEDQFRLMADWYHLAILALCDTHCPKADPRWIARKLEIPVQAASEALQRLERMGILQLKPRLKQLCEPFEAVSELPSEAIRKYHKQNLQLALEKADTIAPAFRQYQSVSLAISRDKLGAFKKLIDRFLDQAAALGKKENGDDIYHLNVQLFPVSRLKDTNHDH